MAEKKRMPGSTRRPRVPQAVRQEAPEAPSEAPEAPEATLYPGESLEVGASIEWHGPRGTKAWVTGKVTVVVQEDETGEQARARARLLVAEELQAQSRSLTDSATGS